MSQIAHDGSHNVDIVIQTFKKIADVVGVIDNTPSTQLTFVPRDFYGHIYDLRPSEMIEASDISSC